MNTGNSKKYIITILLILIGAVAGGVLAIAYYIPELVWIKPFGYIFLGLWLYVAVRKLRKYINKIINDM